MKNFKVKYSIKFYWNSNNQQLIVYFICTINQQIYIKSSYIYKQNSFFAYLDKNEIEHMVKSWAFSINFWTQHGFGFFLFRCHVRLHGPPLLRLETVNKIGFGYQAHCPARICNLVDTLGFPVFSSHSKRSHFFGNLGPVEFVDESNTVNTCHEFVFIIMTVERKQRY